MTLKSSLFFIILISFLTYSCREDNEVTKTHREQGLITESLQREMIVLGKKLKNT